MPRPLSHDVTITNQPSRSRRRPRSSPAHGSGGDALVMLDRIPLDTVLRAWSIRPDWLRPGQRAAFERACRSHRSCNAVEHLARTVLACPSKFDGRVRDAIAAALSTRAGPATHPTVANLAGVLRDRVRAAHAFVNQLSLTNLPRLHVDGGSASTSDRAAEGSDALGAIVAKLLAVDRAALKDAQRQAIETLARGERLEPVLAQLAVGQTGRIKMKALWASLYGDWLRETFDARLVTVVAKACPSCEAAFDAPVVPVAAKACPSCEQNEPALKDRGKLTCSCCGREVDARVVKRRIADRVCVACGAWEDGDACGCRGCGAAVPVRAEHAGGPCPLGCQPQRRGEPHPPIIKAKRPFYGEECECGLRDDPGRVRRYLRENFLVAMAGLGSAHTADTVARCARCANYVDPSEASCPLVRNGRRCGGEPGRSWRCSCCGRTNRASDTECACGTPRGRRPGLVTVHRPIGFDADLESMPAPMVSTQRTLGSVEVRRRFAALDPNDFMLHVVANVQAVVALHERGADPRQLDVLRDLVLYERRSEFAVTRQHFLPGSDGGWYEFFTVGMTTYAWLGDLLPPQPEVGARGRALASDVRRLSLPLADAIDDAVRRLEVLGVLT